MTPAPVLMGVVNVTPDSFSDGGRHLDPQAAIEHGLGLVDEGASMLDIGGESTRPGASPVDEADELARVLPVIRGLRARTDAILSIDTMKPAVAHAALSEGASVWNDVTALGPAPESLEVAARHSGATLILMHMQGTPATMQDAPAYRNVTQDVAGFFTARFVALRRAGITLDRVVIDPGIGFGKTTAHNLALLRNLPMLAALGRPVLVGASRKGFITRVDGTGAGPDGRLGGSIAVALHAARAGAAMLRVHDVAATRQALQLMAALESEGADA
jgi:dihydropteroate synthase